MMAYQPGQHLLQLQEEPFAGHVVVGVHVEAHPQPLPKGWELE